MKSEMNIVKENKNEFLKRKEISISEHFDSNPGYEKMKQEIAHKFKAEPGCIAIKSLKSGFGSRNFVVEFYIYDTVEDYTKMEVRKKKKKKEEGK